jgi:hypothetical protein
MAERKLIILCLLLCSSCAFAQQDTTAPVKDSYVENLIALIKKAEGLFKILTGADILILY